jgi:hypothetical protein
MNIITLVGSAILFFYCVTQIFKFYGFEENAYADYMLFYMIIIVSLIFLPTDISDV